ncbi:hypothetical protein [Coleofasciculus sp. FACHB-T130]|uniref:hypothetical protein n=1 Tax=Cyanophyceae TaxID=3028117 RepID=UPI001685314F|nr:hypothetical protein [Coleofasciculus sp. FACHB-T130]MBD1878776.1 hypothetical protein [Coleofasciculus sp. FACHB-T130]
MLSFYLYARRTGLIVIQPEAITKTPRLTSRQSLMEPKPQVSTHQQSGQFTESRHQIAQLYHLERRTFL